MIEEFFSPQLNNDLVRAAYSITGSLRAAARLLDLSPSTISDHVRANAGVADPFGGPDLVTVKGFSAENLERMDAALNAMDATTLERLSAAQAVVSRGSEGASEGYSLYLKENPDRLNEQITRAIEYAEMTGTSLEDLAVDGIAS